MGMTIRPDACNHNNVNGIKDTQALLLLLSLLSLLESLLRGGGGGGGAVPAFVLCRTSHRYQANSSYCNSLEPCPYLLTDSVSVTAYI